MPHKILPLSPVSLAVGPLGSGEKVYWERLGDLMFNLGDVEAKIRSYLAGYFKLCVLTSICVRQKVEQNGVE